MWIETVPYGEAAGELKAAYDRQARALGEPTEMTLAGSLHPPLVAARLDLYAATETCPSKITPHQRNLISYVTSALNHTPYCMSQVTIKLRQTGLDDERIVALGTDPEAVADDLPPADAELVRYTVKLTKHPGDITEADVAALRSVGFDDLDIVDANAQCAHLNYVNRVSNGLGIHTIVDPDFPAYSAIPDSA
ncbi:MAG: carboxymuconolactone decarboxylase family protein [Actinomycetota bacterium]|nr:carboxymuconolactone decarboxylase family protein [Actinomycetota bacterium]